jgi:hypothetical protein
MLKSFARGFSGGFAKFFTTERVAILVVFLILAYALYAYSGAKTLRVDGMSSGDATPSASPAATTTPAVSATPAAIPTKGAVPSASPAAPTSYGSGYVAGAVASPQDLLPVDQNSQWAALNPVAQGNIAAPDLLQAGYHIGLDTIGQTLRNANLQERSDPIIPKSNVGPWNQSTIDPDLGRVPLEVGCGAR